MIEKYERCLVCQTKARKSFSHVDSPYYYCPKPSTVGGVSHYETDGKSYCQVKTPRFTFVFTELRTHVTHFPFGRPSYVYHEYNFSPNLTFADLEESKVLQMIADYEMIK